MWIPNCKPKVLCTRSNFGEGNNADLKSEVQGLVHTFSFFLGGGLGIMQTLNLRSKIKIKFTSLRDGNMIFCCLFGDKQF